MSHIHAFFIHTYQFCFYHINIKLFGAFLRVSLSHSLYLALVCSMAPKHKSTQSQNPLRFGASSSSSPSDSTPSHVRFRDDKAHKDFRRTSHDEAIIWNNKSFYRIFLILTFPLPFTVGVGNHCVASRSLVPPWSYRCFTPICIAYSFRVLLSERKEFEGLEKEVLVPQRYCPPFASS